MWFGYHPEIVEKYPEIAAAVLWVESFQNVKGLPEIEELLSESEDLIRERCPERAAISQQPSIAGWRDVYSRMGLKPNRYPCATEQLMRRVVDGQPIPRIAALVDLGNAAALRYMITIAPFDVSRVERFCEVRHATGNERFWPINSDTPDEIPEGEVIFADDSPDVISRRWAWRQSDKGKITPETQQVVIVAEAVHQDARQTVQECGEYLRNHLVSLLEAQVRLDILDAQTPRSDSSAGVQTS
jgi:DNA/RNA-binding domain of Phe-tRNA-synthetase-like protein